MTVGQLVDRLQKMIEANPDNANIRIRWYDEFRGGMCFGDGRPVQLAQNHLTKETFCILNAVNGASGIYTMVSDKGVRNV